MGNTSSATSSSTRTQNVSKCNSCSQNGSYFSFGKSTNKSKSSEIKLYAKIKGKNRRVYVDSKGKYYKENSKRRKLPKGTKTYKLSPKRKTVPKDFYLRKKIKSPLRKVVKDKKKKTIGTRLSARTVFNEMGTKGLGKSFRILQKDGKYKIKYLRLRQNGSPYFANKFGKTNEGIVHLNILYNPNWLRGNSPCKMTGIKNSWPNHGYNIPPGGVVQPFRTSLLPRVASTVSRGNSFGNRMNVPHMHYGKMCFGA